MTKSEEIAALAAFTASFPADSYLKNWLEYVTPQIIADIQNDIFPTATPAEARKQAVEILIGAKLEASQISVTSAQEVATAQKKANKPHTVQG